MKIVNQSHIHLCEEVRLCLILLHGNARVESGFSINSEIIENNLKESSLVSQRMLYEGLMKDGEIMKVDIRNKMIDYVGRSHRLYQAAQKESKEHQIPYEKNAYKEKG